MRRVLVRASNGKAIFRVTRRRAESMVSRGAAFKLIEDEIQFSRGPRCLRPTERDLSLRMDERVLLPAATGVPRAKGIVASWSNGREERGR